MKHIITIILTVILFASCYKKSAWMCEYEIVYSDSTYRYIDTFDVKYIVESTNKIYCTSNRCSNKITGGEQCNCRGKYIVASTAPIRIIKTNRIK